MTSGGNNFNNFPDNHITKLGVIICWSRTFISLNFLWNIALRLPPRSMDTPDKHKGQTDVSICGVVLCSVLCCHFNSYSRFWCV